MPERLCRDYKSAQRASKVGAGALYAVAALSLIISLAFCASCPPTGEGGGAWTLSVVAAGLFTAAVALLAEFLRHFGRDSSPFGKSQFARLIAAALLMGLRTVFDAFMPVTEAPSSTDAIPLVTHIDLDLKIVTVIIFLVCLATVVRYGDALKEDSDSIA